MNCLSCNKETNNPKYCSKSCAASRNNVLFPKRSGEKRKMCATCNNIIPSRNKYCQQCITDKSDKLARRTKSELRGDGNANFGGKYPYIRIHSRRTYLKSGKPLACLICNYSVHVEICHIIDVKSFPDSATILEINDLDNLVALCRNHHWEFDHGVLDIASL